MLILTLYEFSSDGSPSFDRPDPENRDLACRKTLTSEIPYHDHQDPTFSTKASLLSDEHETYGTPTVSLAAEGETTARRAASVGFVSSPPIMLDPSSIPNLHALVHKPRPLAVVVANEKVDVLFVPVWRINPGRRFSATVSDRAETGRPLPTHGRQQRKKKKEGRRTTPNMEAPHKSRGRQQK